MSTPAPGKKKDKGGKVVETLAVVGFMLVILGLCGVAVWQVIDKKDD